MKNNEVQSHLIRIYNDLKFLRDKLGDSAEHVECNYEKPDEKFWLVQAMQIEEKMYDLMGDIKYLRGKVVEEGRIFRNIELRYEMNGGGKYWTSGETIEWYDEEEGNWSVSRMEHNGNDYYIVGLGRDKSPEGINVRVRERD